MEFGPVTRAHSHKLSETVVVYAIVRKPGFAYRFSNVTLEKERGETVYAPPISVTYATPHGCCLLQS